MNNYLVEYILSQIVKIILNIFKKKHEAVANNPSIKIYKNKVEDRITFKIKAGCYLELGSTQNKKTKDENEEDVPHFEIVNIVILLPTIITKIQESLYTLY